VQDSIIVAEKYASKAKKALNGISNKRKAGSLEMMITSQMTIARGLCAR
jgi:hypothetical protein